MKTEKGIKLELSLEQKRRYFEAGKKVMAMLQEDLGSDPLGMYLTVRGVTESMEQAAMLMGITKG